MRGRLPPAADAAAAIPPAAPPLSLAHSLHNRQAWAPTREGYLRFLAESKAVYDAFDAAVKTSPQYAPFAATGLERSAALARDIQWFEATYGLKAPALTDDGPGRTYAKLIAGLAGSNPQARAARTHAHSEALSPALARSRPPTSCPLAPSTLPPTPQTLKPSNPEP